MGKVLKTLSWLDCGIFPATVLFSCGFTYEELMQLLKRKRTGLWVEGLDSHKEFVESSNYCYIASTLTDIKTKEETLLYYIVVRKQFKFSDEEYCHLAHEVLHICQNVLNGILDRNKEYEAEAYLHTHLMRQCLKALR